MSFKRILTGVLGFPLVAILLILGNNIIIDIAFSIVAILALKEYFDAVSKKSKPVRWIGYLACIFIALIHIIPKKFVLITIGISVPVFIGVLFIHIIATNMKYTLKDIAFTLLGILYIVGFLLFIPLLHGVEYGKFLIWYIFIAAWGTDIFAYFIGSKFGKHKFTKISPNKSIEGCIGGIVGAIIISLVYTMIINHFIDLNVQYWYIIIVAFILSIFSQIGDLSASCIKRYAEIKDFSDLIPGHGGMLDRIDSIIFIAPYAYFLLMIIGKF